MIADGAEKPFSFEICGGPHVDHTHELIEDGKKFFYTICDGNLMLPDCDIYMSELTGVEWTAGKPLSEEINLKGFTNTQPYYAKSSSGSMG